MSVWEEYVRYLTSRLFSHRDYFTEERLLSFAEFKKERENTIKFSAESEALSGNA